MVCLSETYIFIVAFGIVIWRVAIEKADLAVMQLNQLFKILVFDYYFLQSSGSLLNNWEITPHGMGLAAKAVAAACVAVPDKLIELGSSLYISDFSLFADNMLDTVKILS